MLSPVCSLYSRGNLWITSFIERAHFAGEFPLPHRHQSILSSIPILANKFYLICSFHIPGYVPGKCPFYRKSSSYLTFLLQAPFLKEIEAVPRPGWFWNSLTGTALIVYGFPEICYTGLSMLPEKDDGQAIWPQLR
jgi:hypothetical protein